MNDVSDILKEFLSTLSKEDDGGAVDVHWIAYPYGGIKQGEVPVIYTEKVGGGEGGAEDCHTVLQIAEKFYRIVYSYFSHHGHDFSYADVAEVFPKEKTITVYE